MIKKAGRLRSVPSSEGGGGHSDVLRLLQGAGHVVGEVKAGLDSLAELNHNHVGDGLPVLVIVEC